MRFVRVAGATACVALALMGLDARAYAQSNDEGFPQIPWNFSTPGARANGMGLTFIGVADDLSATATNPAGLRGLDRRIYAEFKGTDVVVERLADPSSLFTLVPSTFATTVRFPSLITVSTPLGRHFTVAVSRHEFLDYEETFHLSARPIPGSPTNSAFFPLDGQAAFTAVNYGVTIATTATKTLRLGVTLASSQLHAESTVTRFNFVRNNPANQFDLSESPVIANQTAIHGSHGGFSLVAGALWQLRPRLSLGFAYAKGPRFTVSETELVNPGFPTVNITPLVPAEGFRKTVHINVPDRIGLGLAFHVRPRLLVAADAVRVGYSILAKDFTVVFAPNVLTGSEFKFNNVIEGHAGGELQLTTGKMQLFARGGVYSNPNHTTKFLGSADRAINAIEAAQFNLLPRDAEVRGTVGAGLKTPSRLQIDAAYLWKREFVLSAGLRF